MKRLMVFQCLFFLLVAASAACAQTEYKLELTNKSGAAIQEIIMTPTEPAGPAHTVKTAIAPGAKAVITRPDGELLRMVITHDAGSFTFPIVSFYGEKDTRATLRMIKPDVPELAFFDGKDLKMALAGDNSAWGFEQILGAFPYGIGTTTLAKAKEMGATGVAGKSELKAVQEWEGNKWALELRFADAQPAGLLRSVTMRYKNPSADKIDLVLDTALKNHGYKVFRTVVDKTTLQHYEFAAQGKDESDVEDALAAMLGGKTPKSVTVFYGPGILVDALADAAKQGASIKDILPRYKDKTIVAYTHTYKNDLEVVVMTGADDFAQQEK